MDFSGMTANVNKTLRGGWEGSPPGSEEYMAQVDRLIASPIFLGSEALCKLLKYLAHHTISAPTDHLKEYKIALEVFRRPTDFDPQADSYVRVQMGRLRSKLAQYYETEGVADAILVDVPKGRYLLLFERRPLTEVEKPVAEAVAEPLPQPVSAAPASPWRTKRMAIISAAILLVLAFSGYVVFHMLHTSTISSKGRVAAALETGALKVFWTPFIQGPDQPIVVFANANFVGNAETGMRYFEASRDSRNEITQHYTGVGEVVGVLELDRLFGRFGRQFRVKRGSLFTLDDARNNNLIFVGSPTENLTLGQIPGTQEFAFRRIPAGSDHWREVIVNVHPQPGESSIYASADETGHEGDDYAVITLRRGLDPMRWTLVLAGTSTIGTQAAADYICDPASVEDLLRRLKVSTTGDLKPFEALLRIKVTDDIPLAIQLAALRQSDH